MCLCLLELFVTATKLLIGNTRNKHGIRNEHSVLGRAVRVRWLIKNMTATGRRPRAGDLKVCIEFICIPQLTPRRRRTWLATWDRERQCQVGSFGRCLLTLCYSDLSSHSSTDQVKGVLTLQGDALCQAVSNCRASCFVLQSRGESHPYYTLMTSRERSS